MIYGVIYVATNTVNGKQYVGQTTARRPVRRWNRSEEHASELQSLRHLVCRLLLEKNQCQLLLHAAGKLPRAALSEGRHARHTQQLRLQAPTLPPGYTDQLFFF